MEQQRQRHRGTRRQQRYRAKQKLMELCELASAQAQERDTESKGKPRQSKTETNPASVGLPDYLNVPNRVFRRMFIAAASEHVPSDIGQWLNVSTNLQETREQARLLDRLLYLRQQQSLWTDYFRVGSTEGVWASEVQDKMTGQSKSALLFVTDYRHGIVEQLERTQRDLDEHQCRTNAGVSNMLHEWYTCAEEAFSIFAKENGNLVFTVLSSHIHLLDLFVRREYPWTSCPLERPRVRRNVQWRDCWTVLL